MASSKKAAEDFVKRWKTKEGSEDREGRSFWIELCGEVLGIANPTYVLDFERKVQGRKIDVFFEDVGVLIEQKSRGVSLDDPEQRGWINKAKNIPRMVTPFEQAKWYADNITPRSIAPKWVITCNFDEMRIYDLDVEYAAEKYETIILDELPRLTHRLSFITRKENSRLEREKQLSIRAGEVVGRLYDAFSTRYHDIENDEQEQRSLNILITRIVFLLYAEDAELLQERNAFYNYLKSFQVQHMRQALIDLFQVLKTPEDERDPYLNPEVAAFPYVNGGLFEADIIIPQFDINTHDILLNEASAEFDWSDISPTIFGAVFESTLNPETRRAGGMHYTSVENIHKVTGPLFYDALKDELTEIEGLKSKTERDFKLRAFRSKIASLKILDPACGSGNFLTETYLSLRKLENRVLENLYGGQMVLGLLDPIQVSIDQFYGIEINDFAVEVAKTALWIAELQMLDETREILNMWIDALPLKSNDNIHEGNALRMDWNDLLPAEQCSYIIGNPPFVGQKQRSAEQKRDIMDVWKTKSIGLLDYVTCWYRIAATYLADNPDASFAFVSTNSITQGEPVPLLFKPLFDEGWRIRFAHKPFKWSSEGMGTASVHVVIIGMERLDNQKVQPTLFTYESVDGPYTTTHPSNINGYLLDAPNVFVTKRNQPLGGILPKVVAGPKAADNGHLIVNADAYEDAMADPIAAKYVRRFKNGKELINDIDRWCLWLVDATQEEIDASPFLSKRVGACRAYREVQGGKASSDAYKLRGTPHLFRPSPWIPDRRYLAIPTVFSGRRVYATCDWLDADTIPGVHVFIAPDEDGFAFAIIESSLYMAWQKAVGGRTKSDCNFSSTVVWNNLPIPDMDEKARERICDAGHGVMVARANHPGLSLADLYDPDMMPDDLLAAHQALDAAVEAAYGVDFNGDEEKIVAHLFKLYSEMTQ